MDNTPSSLPQPPSGWVYQDLESLLEPGGISYGIVQPGSNTADGVPIVRVKNIEGGHINYNDILRVDKGIEQKHRRTRLRGGEILLTLVGSVGEVAVVPPSLAGWNVARAVAVLRPNGSVSSSWIRLCLASESAQHYMRTRQTNTVQATLNLRDVRHIPIIVPPKPVQDAIDSLIGALDDKIAVNEKVASTAERLAVALADQELWPNMVALNTLVHNLREQVSPDSVSATHIAHYSLPAFDTGRRPEIVPPSSIRSGKLRVDQPCVLVSKLNPATPRIWLVFPSPELPAVASTEFLVLRPADGLRPAEIWAICSQKTFTDELTGKTTGTSNSHQRVRPTDLLESLVVDPRQMSADTRFQIESLTARAIQARAESASLAELRDTLLPKLMSGEIRVRDAEKVVEDAV